MPIKVEFFNNIFNIILKFVSHDGLDFFINYSQKIFLTLISIKFYVKKFFKKLI